MWIDWNRRSQAVFQSGIAEARQIVNKSGFCWPLLKIHRVAIYSDETAFLPLQNQVSDKKEVSQLLMAFQPCWWYLLQSAGRQTVLLKTQMQKEEHVLSGHLNHWAMNAHLYHSCGLGYRMYVSKSGKQHMYLHGYVTFPNTRTDGLSAPILYANSDGLVCVCTCG